jgi:DMSO/TMAO reductase YedYZ molybdopterin-dependent catalytic subunit
MMPVRDLSWGFEEQGRAVIVREAKRLAARTLRWVAQTPALAAQTPPFREGSFRSTAHDERLAAWLGIALGITFTLCFATGLLSHLVQHASLQSQPVFTAGGWLPWPSRPAGLYRLTQGIHVTTGLVSIPLLLAKLFVVYPHLWTWPPVRGIAHAVERAGLPLLVGGGLFLLVTGVQNIANWYPWGFFFPTAHYWAAWITIGALLMHIFAKAHITRRVLAGRGRGRAAAAPAEAGDGAGDEAGLTRRGVLAVAGGAAGVMALVTVGQTFSPLERLALLAPRRPSVGPQGTPVNKTASGARVVEAAMDPSWRLRVTGRVTRELALSLDDLRGMPQREAVLPIACVEGWSASRRWSGVALRDVLMMAGAPPGASVRVDSLQRAGLYRASILNPAHARDPDTLLALELEGEALHIDHGFPARLISPNNPGVLQTKWLATVTVL